MVSRLLDGMSKIQEGIGGQVCRVSPGHLTVRRGILTPAQIPTRLAKSTSEETKHSC